MKWPSSGAGRGPGRRSSGRWRVLGRESARTCSESEPSRAGAGAGAEADAGAAAVVAAQAAATTTSDAHLTLATLRLAQPLTGELGLSRKREALDEIFERLAGCHRLSELVLGESALVERSRNLV